MPNELKPEEVVQALAWYEVVGRNIGSVTMPYDEVKGIIALLHEKDEGIEILREINSFLTEAGQEWEKRYKTARSEAINELVERLKKEMNDLSRMEYFGQPYFLVSKSFIDKIAEDMKGEPE